MLITFLGHSAFLIVTSSGTRIVTDPYDTSVFNEKLLYKAFTGEADVVTVSHSHGDHSGTRLIKGKPSVLSMAGTHTTHGVKITGVAAAHDEIHGATRGKNVIFVIEADGLRIVHCGDLGHILTEAQQSEVGRVDVLMIPVGGYYTIDAAKARIVAEQLRAKLVIPMHYRNAKCLFPIADVDSFLVGWEHVIRGGTSEVEVTSESLPESPTVCVLEPLM